MTAVPAILAPFTGDSARARLTDMTTSHEAADSISRDALEDSEREVLEILVANDAPMTDGEISDDHRARAFWGRAVRTYSETRLRTARKQLVDVGVVVAAGRRANATPSGRSAMTWTLAGTEAQAA